ncbi:asparagine synthase-related protein [Opitutus terrae]|uniref:asparagine synthase (glutamine-hydrolyzing) n=1 Tax=Opitutus terrae (strain DSM 11246 / JCM 15787 / PB90-1) TaxID=452637 RepID=B1ZT90_OPITP|nr:asparagine synthase-related protein [Opitutus terrae]ACB76544.1 asparagine synthase [Opitutus terrae PB90-1]
MANFLLVHDPDTVRRQFAVLQARDRVGFLPQMRGELTLASHYALAWAAAPLAPVEHHRATEPDAPDCMLFGAPHDHEGVTLKAADFCRRHDIVWDAPNELNGYYAALLVHPRLGVRIEGDVLGLFPLYYWQHRDVLLVGTSPELFRSHPSFQSELDLHGAAALLLTSGLVGGRTLWRGVRRLAADHRLIWLPGAAPRELPPPLRAAGDMIESRDEAVEQAAELHASFLRAALRDAQRPGMLLSGGLDSRLLAGFAAEQTRQPECLTFGRPEDLDAACATAVARELGLKQSLYDVTPEDYAQYAQSSVTWEQLSGGLYALPMGWNLSLRPPTVEIDRLICGLTLDAVIGGPKYVARTSGALSFERLRIGRLGFGRDELARLIGAPDLARACEDVRGELLDEYVASAASDHLREWRMNLAHRHRFAVGMCAWRYSLFAWPVLPALDRRLIALAHRLPYSVIKDRQIQTRLLVTRFPRLARLDLDRNYFDTVPLLGSKTSAWRDLRRRATKLRRRCQTWLGRDPRFYVRTMEFNSPGWRVVRSLAEEARGAGAALFRTDALERLLPRADVRVRHIEDPIVHSTPLKNTLGLMLWLRQHA